ncbi:hypothetical protein [Arthrobacter sp. UYEF20]|uniref:hypothetical protein n=1 Tax=Arthrobacter sp. UYEF20 TaxID=1756363 RepID=UPI00339B4439
MTAAILGHQRTMLQLGVGSVPHRDILRAIELLGTEVAPIVRAEVARREQPTTKQSIADPTHAGKPDLEAAR